VTLQELLPPFEQRGMDLSLIRIQRALAALGSPSQGIPAVQVVGTNGKGSVATLIDSGLRAAGIRSGLTTSPHLIDWCERIRVEGRMISSQELENHLIALQPLAKRERLTPFELLISAALMHFKAEAVDWMVLEAGLGGRLDATTAHPHRPLVAVASIGLDHCEHLGDTLAAVATEKAAVIEAGTTVISARQAPEVEVVLEQRVQDVGAALHWVPPLPDDWRLGLQGAWQRENGAVALAVLERIGAMGWPISPSSIRSGFAAAHWPGRMQPMRWRGHPLLLDGAHNPAAAARLAAERRHWPGERGGIDWILGIQAHKQAEPMLNSLLQPSDRAWIVPVPDHRSWSAEALQRLCPDLAHQLLETSGPDPVLSVLDRLECRGWPQVPPVIAGSLYLLGDLLRRDLLHAE
jgi:dihydrofolate synthase / folylpolyglutamate synthase